MTWNDPHYDRIWTHSSLLVTQTASRRHTSIHCVSQLVEVKKRALLRAHSQFENRSRRDASPEASHALLYRTQPPKYTNQTHPAPAILRETSEETSY